MQKLQANSLRAAASIVGVGSTDYRALKKSGRSASLVELAVTATHNALRDAKMESRDIDGLVTFNVPSDAIALRMSIQDLRMRAEYPYGGRWVVPGLQQAAQSLAMGFASAVVAVLALSRTASYADSGAPGGMALFESMHAMGGPAAHSALMVRRYMHEYGDCARALAEIAMSNRSNASLNPAAVFQDEMTEEAYFASRYIAEPLRLFDYCMVNDGAVAFVLTRTPSAPGHRAVTLGGFGYSTHQGIHFGAPDFYYQQAQAAAKSMFTMADVGAKDVNVLQIYDNYTPSVLFSLEGFGFVKRGEAGEFIRAGNIRRGGSLPLNTSGGQTSEAYMQGMSLVAEAVHQLRGEAGHRQVSGVKIAAFTIVTPMAGGCVLWR